MTRYCVSEDELKSSHVIVSGPYTSPEGCGAECGDCGSDAIQPPLIGSDNPMNGNILFNINDYAVTVFMERSTDGGNTWSSFATISLESKLAYNWAETGLVRARCSADGKGTSSWSYNYNYPNFCSVQPPVVVWGLQSNGNKIFNINNYLVLAFLEKSRDGGNTWSFFTTVSMQANSTYAGGFSSFQDWNELCLLRARCTPLEKGGGSSVSPWSYGYENYPNPDNIQPPVVGTQLLFNINDERVFVFLEQSTDEGFTWVPFGAGPVALVDANSLYMWTGPGLFRAKCSTESGTSVSSWSYNYNYPNPDNIQPPVVEGSSLLNPNNFQVVVFIEQSTDGGSNWIFAGTAPVNANSAYTWQGGPGVFRARCASANAGTSVSPWSA